MANWMENGLIGVIKSATSNLFVGAFGAIAAYVSSQLFPGNNFVLIASAGLGAAVGSFTFDALKASKKVGPWLLVRFFYLIAMFTFLLSTVPMLYLFEYIDYHLIDPLSDTLLGAILFIHFLYVLILSVFVFYIHLFGAVLVFLDAAWRSLARFFGER